MTNREFLLNLENMSKLNIAERESGEFLFANNAELDALLEYKVENNIVIRPENEIYPVVSDNVIELGLMIANEVEITENNVDTILKLIENVQDNNYVVTTFFAYFEIPSPEEETKYDKIVYTLWNDEEYDFTVTTEELEDYEYLCYDTFAYSFERKLYFWSEGFCCIKPPSISEITKEFKELSFVKKIENFI